MSLVRRMLRAFLVLLAIFIAVLAIVFDRPLLYAGAIVPLLGVLGLLGLRLWNSYRDQSQEKQRSPHDFSARSDSLEDVGIVDVRPKERPDDEATPNEDEGPADSPAGAPVPSPTNGSVEGESPSTDVEGARMRANGNPAEHSHEPEDPQTGEGLQDDGLTPLVRSLRSALGAQTVCLLLQEEVLLTYRIEALASAHSTARHTGSFDTQVPLLTAGMSRQPVTIRDLSRSEVAVDDLNYYEHPPDIEHFAVAPVPRPDEPVSYFLLADSNGDADLGASRARALLEHFAETAALLLDSQEDARMEADVAEEPTPDDAPSPSPSSESESETSDRAEGQPRPRRDIIAEEMKAAETASEDLALTLVHLNRAESIARRGPASVASAERMLRARLEQLAPNQRIERFGELTFGIFFRGGVDAVEPWAADLQEVLAEETGELEGGVSVGVAIWGERHDAPEALRSDATEALWEAYETGTCTIVA